MADTARVTQSAIENLTLENGVVHLTQDAIEFLVNVGVLCDNPPAGHVGVAYSHTFPAGGGEAPYTFSIIVGFLPPGLTLNASTGVASGVPSVAGTFHFTIQVNDSQGGVNTVACSITIAAFVGSVGILLYGWKLYPVEPCGEVAEVADIPHVKRAV